MKFASLIFALGFLASAMVSTPALAATATASFSVTATVLASCQVSAPASAYGANTAPRANAASPASVNCTNPTPYDVSYSTELAPSATATTRNTAGPALDSPGSALLPNSAHNVNWGRMADAYAMSGTARGSSHPYAGYGHYAGAQHVAPGAFADSVMITVTY
jgi:spore coat protein U-like protein